MATARPTRSSPGSAVTCRRASRVRPSPSCPPTSPARSSISARPHRSTSRSPGRNGAANRIYAQKLLARVREDSRTGRCAHPAAGPRTAARRRGRSLARRPIWADRTRRHDQPRQLAGRHLADRARVLREPGERRVLSGRRPGAGISRRHDGGAVEPAGLGAPAPTACSRSAVSPRSRGRALCRSSRTTISRRCSISTPPRRVAISARSRAISSARSRRSNPICPRGTLVTIRGQYATMNTALFGPGLRSRRRDRAHLPADRRQLPELGRSLRHHHRAAPPPLAGIVWMLFHHRHDPVGAGADRGDHVHGRRHRQFDPRRQLRARAAGGARRCDGRGARGGPGAFPPGPDDGARHDSSAWRRWRSASAKAASRTRHSAAP